MIDKLKVSSWWNYKMYSISSKLKWKKKILT